MLLCAPVVVVWQEICCRVHGRLDFRLVEPHVDWGCGRGLEGGGGAASLAGRFYQMEASALAIGADRRAEQPAKR